MLYGGHVCVSQASPGIWTRRLAPAVRRACLRQGGLRLPRRKRGRRCRCCPFPAASPSALCALPRGRRSTAWCPAWPSCRRAPRMPVTPAPQAQVPPEMPSWQGVSSRAQWSCGTSNSAAPQRLCGRSSPPSRCVTSHVCLDARASQCQCHMSMSQGFSVQSSTLTSKATISCTHHLHRPAHQVRSVTPRDPAFQVSCPAGAHGASARRGAVARWRGRVAFARDGECRRPCGVQQGLPGRKRALRATGGRTGGVRRRQAHGDPATRGAQRRHDPPGWPVRACAAHARAALCGCPPHPVERTHSRLPQAGRMRRVGRPASSFQRQDPQASGGPCVPFAAGHGPGVHSR